MTAFCTFTSFVLTVVALMRATIYAARQNDLGLLLATMFGALLAFLFTMTITAVSAPAGFVGAVALYVGVGAVILRHRQRQDQMRRQMMMHVVPVHAPVAQVPVLREERPYYDPNRLSIPATPDVRVRLPRQR